MILRTLTLVLLFSWFSRLPISTRPPATFAYTDIVLVDTAGIRRRGKIGRGIERYSVLRAMRAIERCDVAVLLIDATEPLTAQDTHVAGYILEQSKGVVVAVNKWDAVPKESNTMAEFERALRAHFNFLPFV